MRDIPTDLPGNDFVSAGIADLTAGRETEYAMLVAMAAPRLRALGFEIPVSNVEYPSHRLYELIATKESDAHSRYNALVGRVVSFARAVEHAPAS